MGKWEVYLFVLWVLYVFDVVVGALNCRINHVVMYMCEYELEWKNINKYYIYY